MLDTGLESLVTYNPLAVTPDTALDVALNWMEEYHFRHLPVVDADRRLVGIASDLDVRRAALASAKTIGDVMTTGPAAVTQNSTPGEALRIMLAGNFHSVPVVDGDRLVGIVTSSDYLREFSYGGFGGDTLLSGHAIEDSHIDAGATIEEARLAMEQGEHEYLAVLKGELPVGAVSRRAVKSWLDFSTDSKPADAKVLRLAATNVAVLRPTDTLQEAARQMLDRGMQVVLVADRANRYRGLVTERVALTVMGRYLGEV